MLSNSSKEKNSEVVQGIPGPVSSDKWNRTFNFPPNNRVRADDHPFLGTKHDRKIEYLDCDDEESKRRILADSSSYNSENENHGKYLKGKIIDETKQEIAQHIENSDVESVQLRVRSPIRTMLTARIVLNDNKGKINISNILTNDFFESNRITAVTLLLPGDEKRGMRGRVDEHGVRIYEVANGLCDS
ncbi:MULTISPECIES: hypothetical protein [Wolbachia]|uniref:hypothetical protein n=2 Tax=Wolbachieae TaxID=952 RepID=UPI00201FDB5D|nr:MULTISPECIES: hypothetical protein [unclassified Wolbachia]